MTVAIPLHRSAPFVEVVLANIANIDVPGAEIVVSDRTVLDDAAERIRAATADDPRVRVEVDPQGIGWVDHHALLLAQARAPLAMLMPHDDDFPAGFVGALVVALAEAPDALLAFGDLHADGVAYPEPPSTLHRRPWRAVEAAALLARWSIGVPYRWVLRVEELRARQVRLRRVGDGAWCDELFVFEVALCGPLVHVPGVECTKRFHGGSTHQRWSIAPWRTGRLHLVALWVLARRGRDRTVPRAAAVIVRRWWAFVVTYLRQGGGAIRVGHGPGR
ncbi:MAG: hypothetical protein ACSLFP_00010 [Acidimicrobiales bacterium]